MSSLKRLHDQLCEAKLCLQTEEFLFTTSGFRLDSLRNHAREWPAAKKNKFVLSQVGKLNDDVQKRLHKLKELEEEVSKLKSAIAEEEERLKVAEEVERPRVAEELQRRPLRLAKQLEQQQFEAATAASLLEEQQQFEAAMAASLLEASLLEASQQPQSDYDFVEEIMSALEKEISEHKKRVKGQDGLDEFGRSPAPKDWKKYRFSYRVGKWVPAYTAVRDASYTSHYDACIAKGLTPETEHRAAEEHIESSIKVLAAASRRTKTKKTGPGKKDGKRVFFVRLKQREHFISVEHCSPWK